MAKRALTTLAPDDAKVLYPTPPKPDGPKQPPAPRPTPPPELANIQKNMGQMRGLPTDADRAKLTLQIVADIRALPPAIPKLGPISGLGNVVTEGDLGKEALNAVASTIALALKETPGTASNYIELARLIRYELLRTPLAVDPSLDAANAVPALHDHLCSRAVSRSTVSTAGRTISTPCAARWCC